MSMAFGRIFVPIENKEHSHLVFCSLIALVWMCNEQMKYVLLCKVYGLTVYAVAGWYIFDIMRIEKSNNHKSVNIHSTHEFEPNY